VAQIIPKNPITVEPSWQKELAQCITEPEELLRVVGLDPSQYKEDCTARRLFPMRVPRHFAAQIKRADPADPLLRQVMPLRQEYNQAAGYSADPLIEQQTAGKGLLHKYQSRVLLIVRGGCAVNCRYCFRRHFPYQDNAASRQDMLDNLEYVAQRTEINEVILSGGDPLMAKDDYLAWLTSQIADIPHVTRLRIHTRLPIVIPQRVTRDMLQWLTSTRLNPVVVLHCNHAQEISPSVKDALHKMKSAGVTLLNQAVLLAGVNDHADAVVDLNEALFSAGTLPYYLHTLDKVQGAAHFAVPDDKAKAIMAEVIKRQPGYLVPKLVREIGGQPGKTPLDLQLHP